MYSVKYQWFPQADASRSQRERQRNPIDLRLCSGPDSAGSSGTAFLAAPSRVSLPNSRIRPSSLRTGRNLHKVTREEEPWEAREETYSRILSTKFFIFRFSSLSLSIVLLAPRSSSRGLAASLWFFTCLLPRVSPPSSGSRSSSLYFRNVFSELNSLRSFRIRGHSLDLPYELLSVARCRVKPGCGRAV